MTRPFDLASVIDDHHIVVCCGSGGVGKTTMAAALALLGAARGRRTVVVTIDPARRLAQSLGLHQLDNTPRLVAGVGLDGGELHAMMLDMKRTFDDIVVAYAEPERARQILANPFYIRLSSSLAGTQEYMAMEKLGQLHSSGEWDLIVIDTPPTRSALDFLDAPDRMTRFLDGRLLRLLTAPARASGRFGTRLLNVGLHTVGNVVQKITGAELLQDLNDFFSAFETMFGGFRERAKQTYRLLQDARTAFVVIAAPEPAALREAAYFAERLSTERMPLAGVVVNRVHATLAPALTVARAVAAAEALDEKASGSMPAALLRVHADRVALAAQERKVVAAFVRGVPGVPLREVPAMATDVHDLDGLRRFGTELTRPA